MSRADLLFVKWDNELHQGFNQLVQERGSYRAAAHALGTNERNIYNLTRGTSRSYIGGKPVVVPRLFVQLRWVERLAVELEDPMIENREAQPQGVWISRGEWGNSLPRPAHIGWDGSDAAEKRRLAQKASYYRNREKRLARARKRRERKAA